MNNLDKIDMKEPEMYEAINKLIEYIADTYNDKYEKSPLGNPAKEILYSKHGKAANLFTVMKYIQRYSTEGFDKSDDLRDLFKAVHYLLFEIVRASKHKHPYTITSEDSTLKEESTWGWCTTCHQPYPYIGVLNCTLPNCPQFNYDEE